jgi:hypothetical protein
MAGTALRNLGIVTLVKVLTSGRVHAHAAQPLEAPKCGEQPLASEPSGRLIGTFSTAEGLGMFRRRREQLKWGMGGCPRRLRKSG